MASSRDSIAPPPGAGASKSASISSSCSSTSFPPPRKSFTPLYSGGLCDADDDDSEVVREQGDCRRREDAAENGSAARRRDAACHGLLELRPGAARVPSDEHTPALRPQRGRFPDLLDEIRGQLLADDPADSVRPEVSPRHGGRG